MLYNHVMVKEKLENYMQMQGFFPLSSSAKEVTAMVKIENNFLNILQIIDFTKDYYLNPEQYKEIKNSMKKIFQDRGIENVHILSLFLKEDMEKGEDYIEEDPFSWEFDVNQMKLIIGENKQPDFYGMKGLLEKFINSYDTLEEKEKQADAVSEEQIKEEEKKIRRKRLATYWKRAPYVTISIIAVNIIVAVFCMWKPDIIYNFGSLLSEKVRQGEWYRLVTAMFIHGGIDHIFNNMLLLYFLGEIIEKKIGKWRYLALYFLTGIIGNVMSCIYEMNSGNCYISYGASGAVYGLIGVLLYLVLVYREKTIKISIPAMLVMIAYCVYSSFAGENINVVAHLGGLISGMMLMFIFYPVRRKRNG